MGSTLQALRSDLADARRSRDKVRTLVLTTTLAEVRNREIELGRALDDEGAREVLARAIKQRRDAARIMADGGRPELADRELEQASVLAGYLPRELSAADVRDAVREIVAGGASHMGAVMGALMPRIRGRFDGREASRIALEELRGDRG